MDAFISGAWRTAKRGEVFVAGSWRRITRAEIYRDGQWRRCLSFAPPMTVSVSPSTASGGYTGRFPASRRVTTQNLTATPVGGTGPYSYAWTVTSGAATANSPSMAVTTLSAQLAPDSVDVGNVRVVCTDAQGNTAIGLADYYLYNETDNSGGQNQS